MQLPTIETPLLLDLLFGVIVLLFVPFGVRRGAGKEVVVSAGLLLSAAVAGAWAEPWGAWLAGRFAIESGVARFVVTVGILLIGLVGLGWIGGAALGRVRPWLAGRLAGGALAAMNGAFLLAQVLTAVERDLQLGGDMTGSAIGGELLRDRDRLLLAAAGVALVFAVVGWLSRSMRREPADSTYGAGFGARQRPVRVAAGSDAGKYEPDGGGVNPQATQIGATTPLPARAERDNAGANGGPWWRPSPPAPLPSNGHRPAGLPDDWSRMADPTAGAGSSWQAQRDQTYHRTVEFQAGSAGGRRFGGAGQTEHGDDRERCPTCGAHVTANDLFCPSCGKTL